MSIASGTGGALPAREARHGQAAAFESERPVTVTCGAHDGRVFAGQSACDRRGWQAARHADANSSSSRGAGQFRTELHPPCTHRANALLELGEALLLSADSFPLAK